jgi:hypothetical protein
MNQPKQSLYRVVVEAKGEDALLAVGPAMMREACDQFANTIEQQIRLGREKNWSNPHVIPNSELEN